MHNLRYEACRKCRIAITVNEGTDGDVKRCGKCMKTLQEGDIVKDFNCVVHIKIGKTFCMFMIVRDYPVKYYN